MKNRLLIEIKEVAEEGTFNGYGAVFSNVDLHGDKIAPGAFAKSLARIGKSGSMPPILWGHNPNEPIGVATELSEDARGLKMSAKFVMEVGRAREAHALMKAGALRGEARIVNHSSGARFVPGGPLDAAYLGKGGALGGVGRPQLLLVEGEAVDGDRLPVVADDLRAALGIRRDRHDPRRLAHERLRQAPPAPAGRRAKDRPPAGCGG
jgi:hypothetical protein